MEEKTKKTAAAKTSTKKVEAVSPKEKPTAAKAVKAAATEKSVAATKAAPKAKAVSKAKPVDPPVAAEKPAAKKASASKAKPADAPVAAEKPVAKKAAASKAKSADAPVAAEKPAAKKAAASKAKSTDVPVAAEKPAAKKAAASKAKPAVAPVAAEKPAAKKAAASKAKSADAPVAAEKPAAKKAAASKAKSADAPVAAEKPAAKKAAGKSKAIAAEPTIAETKTPSGDEASSKVRSKPRRRELKRLGLLKPKENKKQKRFDDAQKARLEAKEAPKAKGKDNKKPAEIRQETAASEKSVAAPQIVKGNSANKSAQASEGKSKRDHKAEDRDEPKAKVKGKDSKSKPKLMPEEFGGFQKQISPKAERKNERRKERQEKAEREQDQSHGLFEQPIRLNRFVALSGICSRRDADGLISDGKVKVNGKVVKEMGFKVQPGKDKVVFKDHELRIKVFVYLLMNKPKNKLATTEDDLGRDTVMEIAERYTKARVYPVGRLDRNATGLLLLTNDGDLTKKLTQAGSKFTKIYHVRLDKEVSETQILAMRKGISLEEGVVKADKVEYLSNGGLNELAIQIQSGANHVVKRMVEQLGFEIVTLDRVQFGPLDKRGLPRGTCRLLSEKEVGFLKML